jgi:PKD repeat protein
VGSTAALQNAATASPTFIPDVIGGYSVQLTVVTAAGASTDSVMITVTPPPNHAPVANDDGFSTDENAALIVTAPGLTGNDVDLDGDTLTASKVTDPAHGTVAISPTGGFEYQPAAGYNGPDTFTYQVSDGFQSSNISTVSIDVRPFIHEFLETVTVIDSVRKLPDITLALLNTPVVGVGLPATLQVTLEEPAPPGGVIVTVRPARRRLPTVKPSVR